MMAGSPRSPSHETSMGTCGPLRGNRARARPQETQAPRFHPQIPLLIDRDVPGKRRWARGLDPIVAWVALGFRSSIEINSKNPAKVKFQLILNNLAKLCPFANMTPRLGRLRLADIDHRAFAAGFDPALVLGRGFFSADALFDHFPDLSK